MNCLASSSALAYTAPFPVITRGRSELRRRSTAAAMELGCAHGAEVISYIGGYAGSGPRDYIKFAGRSIYTAPGRPCMLIRTACSIIRGIESSVGGRIAHLTYGLLASIYGNS